MEAGWPQMAGLRRRECKRGLDGTPFPFRNDPTSSKPSTAVLCSFTRCGRRHAATIPDAHVQIVEALLAAGAAVPETHPPVNAKIDALLERTGATPNRTGRWLNE